MLHEIYKKLRIVPPVLLNYRYSVQVVEPLFLILYVHRAKTVEYIRAVTRKKVFMLHFQFIQVLSWYNPAVFNMPFFPAFFEFHCSGNLSRWPHSLGFSLLINITICFIRYVITWVRNIREKPRWPGCLVTAGTQTICCCLIWSSFVLVTQAVFLCAGVLILSVLFYWHSDITLTLELLLALFL